MNIFILDRDAATSARMMCDKHVVKMILESCQLLSTAHHVLDGEELLVNTGKRKYKTYICTNKNICKATMMNHPCTIWARETRSNYIWLWRHAYALCKEYTRRYNKIHAMESMLLNELHDPPLNIKKGAQTPFAQAMPENYKDSNAVVAYRKYYINEKARFAKWKLNDEPEWYKEKDTTYKSLEEEYLPF
jgi:hypothetical protein